MPALPNAPVQYSSGMDPLTSSVSQFTVGGDVASATVAAGVNHGSLVTGTATQYNLGGIASGHDVNASAISLTSMQTYHEHDQSLFGGAISSQQIQSHTSTWTGSTDFTENSSNVLGMREDHIVSHSSNLTGVSDFKQDTTSSFGVTTTQTQASSCGLFGCSSSSSFSETCGGQVCFSDSFSCKDGICCQCGCDFCGAGCNCSDESICCSIASCAKSVVCCIPELLKDCECGADKLAEGLCCVFKCVADVVGAIANKA